MVFVQMNILQNPKSLQVESTICTCNNMVLLVVTCIMAAIIELYMKVLVAGADSKGFTAGGPMN